MQNVLLISLGAVLGANLRYFVTLYVARVIPSSFPIATLLINISASLILGFFLTWAAGRVTVDPRLRIFVAVGFCATYSTYSSFAFETFALFQRGQLALALLNMLATNVVCLVAVVLGAAATRLL